MRAKLLPAALALAVLAGCEEKVEPLVIGAKNFTESTLLAEMTAQLAELEGIPVERRIPLGTTFEVFELLKQGAIDLYPEYNGTGLILLGQTPISDGAEATAKVEALFGELELDWLGQYGFSNDYVLAMTPERAAALDVETIGDLSRQPEVHFAIDQEYSQRPIDGLGALVRRYGLRQGDVVEFPNTREGKDQIVQALLVGDVDVAELYSTDGHIAQYGLVVLEDDLSFFPVYQPAPLVRRETLARFPQLEAALAQLDGKLSDGAVSAMNAAVEFGGETVEGVAARFLAEQQILPSDAAAATAVEGLRVAAEPGASLSGSAGTALRAGRTVFPERAVGIGEAADPVAAVASGAARLGVATSEAFFRVENGAPVRATSAEALGVLGYEVVHLIARTDGPADLGAVTRLSVGPAGGSGERMGRMLLAGLGRDGSVELSSGEDALAALQAGETDAALIVAPEGDERVIEALEGGGLRLLPLGAWTEGTAAIRFSFLRPGRIPAGVYPGQSAPVDSITTQVVLVGPSSQREAIGAQGPNTVGAAPTQPLAPESIVALNAALGTDELVHPALPTAPALRPALATDSETGIRIDPWAALVNLLVVVLIGYLFYLLVAKPREEIRRAEEPGA